MNRDKYADEQLFVRFIYILIFTIIFYSIKQKNLFTMKYCNIGEF